MTVKEVNPFDELFTHVESDGAQSTYNVTRLYEHAVAHATEIAKVMVPVDAEHAQYCVEQRGVEPDRIAVLVEHPEYLKKPVLFIAMPDGSHLLADGTHRYVVFFAANCPMIPAYIVPWSMAAPFKVEDMPTTPEDELMKWSAISVLRELRGGMN